MSVKRILGAFALVASAYAVGGVVATQFGPQKNDAEAALKMQGYSEIQTQHSLATGAFRCSKGEMFNSYDFTAKNQSNEAVSGHLCQGLFKGATVRF